MADSDFVKKRLEKDLAELKKFIDAHFKQREADEQELNLLKERIEKRKTVSIILNWVQNNWGKMGKAKEQRRLQEFI